jgi:hypothetical protein
MSAAIYRLLLRLYPEEIRRSWEEEMVETFALQLQLAREGMAIPIVSLASSGAVFFGLTWALGNSLALRLLYHRLLDKLGG